MKWTQETKPAHLPQFTIRMKQVVCLSVVLLAPGTLCATDWPQWRGPDRTGLAPSGVRVPTHLPASPKVLWQLDIGGGFSSPVVAGDKLVYLDAQGDRETAHALDARTGRELWRVDYDAVYKDEWGPGPRSTPLLEGNRVYVQSCRGEFRCLDLADGQTVWRTSFEKDFGVTFLGSQNPSGTATRRGNNGSGVMDGHRLVLPVGGTNGASLVCFDKHTGRVLWKAGDDEAAYSSLMVGTLAGVRQVVALTAEALLGVEMQTGRLLWRVPLKTAAKRHAVTPVIAGDHVIVGSFSVGLICTRISRDGEGLTARGVWTNSALRVNLSTPVLLGEHLFLQAPLKQLACAEARTGRTTWTQPGFAQTYSALIGLGERLLVLTDRGELHLLAANNRKYTELGRTTICGETWSHPAYAEGRLYVREGLTEGWKLSCLELMP